MKWNEDQANKLRELCSKGMKNKDIAAELKCSLNDVYAKRSQLGITIDKCKPSEIKESHIGLKSNIKSAFEALNNEILITMAGNSASYIEATIYKSLSDLIISIRSNADELLKGLKAGEK